MQRQIKKERIFNHTAAEVWDAISLKDDLANWFMDGNFNASEGKTFEFMDKPGEKWKGVYNGEIISSQPPLNLAYSWCHRKLKHTTYVWWRVEEKNGKSILRLEHSGFKGLSDYFSGFYYSWFWNSKLRKLKNYLKQKESEIVQDRSNP